MNNILLTPNFQREFKRLYKKYKSLKNDLSYLVEQLKTNPNLGVSLGNNVRKVRMQISSKSKGKSGGARVITFTIFTDFDSRDIHLLYIYDKNERSSISANEINDLIRKNGF